MIPDSKINFLKGQVSFTSNYFVVVLSEHEIIGYLGIDVGACCVSDIYVMENWRRKGIATKLWFLGKDEFPCLKQGLYRTPIGIEWAKKLSPEDNDFTPFELTPALEARWQFITKRLYGELDSTLVPI